MPPARTCPACGARAAGRSEQNWVEEKKDDVVVGAGTAANGGDQISAFFLKGRGARKGRKAEGVASGSCLLPVSSPPACQGTGEPSAALSKSWCVFSGPKIKEPWNEPLRDQA